MTRIAGVTVALGTCALLVACSTPVPNASPGTLIETVVAYDGDVLSGTEAEVFQEHATPVSPNEIEHAVNTDLGEVEIEKRAATVADAYEVGEPLSEVDLEFVRAYLVPSGSAPSSEAPTIVSASYNPAAAELEIVPAASVGWTCASTSRTAAGVTACTYGTSTINIGAINHTWTGGWTAKRTSGLSLTSMKSTLKVELYGAVAAWPYIGKIVDWSRSATATGVQSTYFSRNGSGTGAVAYYNMNGNTVFTTSSGTFQIGN